MFNLISKIPHDKLLHFIAGILLFMLLTVFKVDAFIALIGVAFIGTCKEMVYDGWIKKGKPDVMDFIATVVGGIVTFIYNILILL